MTDRVPRTRLRLARLRLGWSKERAADEIARRFPHLCIDARQIGRWEAGETRTPRPMNVLALSTTYGLRPEELDLPPVPGADATWCVPRAAAPDRRAAAPPPNRQRDQLAVQGCSADGEFVTLVVSRRDVVEALGGTVATAAAVDGTEPDAERGASLLGEPRSASERDALSQTIGRNIEAAWSLFHTADTDHMLAVGRTQLAMLKRHHAALRPAVLSSFYSAAYRLLGATHHRRGCYEQALAAHDRAYLAALEGGDPWSMAGTRSWQAYGLLALGRDAESLAMIEAALRLVSERDDPESIRLRARLLSSAALNAANRRDGGQAAAMLQASEALLGELPELHEEFDRIAWLADAGVCSLRLGEVQLAVTRLRRASDQTPRHWVARHVFASLALAAALVMNRDRDAVLAVTKRLIPGLVATRSRELTDHVVDFLRSNLLRAFPGDGQCLALVGEAQHALSTDR